MLTNIDASLNNPFPYLFNPNIIRDTDIPTIKLIGFPKVSLPIPPAKFFIAIGKSPRPIHATIVPDTAGVNINRIFLRPKPIIIITIPAII